MVHRLSADNRYRFADNWYRLIIGQSIIGARLLVFAGCDVLWYVGRGYKQMYGLFFPASKKASVFVVDTVRTNQMPNMTNLYNTEHATKLVIVLPDWLFTP